MGYNMKKNNTNFMIQELADTEQKEHRLNADFLITDINHNPLRDVIIDCNGTKIATTSNGIGVLYGLKNKKQTITIHKNGYTDKTVTLRQGIKQQSFTITLEAIKKNIVVQVTDGTDKLANVNVNFTNITSNAIVNCVTNNQGKASISIPIGSYTVVASLDNYEIFNGSATITTKTSQFNIELVASEIQSFQITSPTFEEEEGFF